MIRPHSFRCQFGSHFFDEADADDFGRVWCARCGTRQPKRHEQIQTEEQRGRELNRPKTRGQR